MQFISTEATMGFDLNNVTEEAGHDFRTAIIEMGEICYYRYIYLTLVLEKLLLSNLSRFRLTKKNVQGLLVRTYKIG